jgi:hypothetical protein
VRRATDELAAWIAGFVAGEGCFSRSSGGRRFRFSVGLGAIDQATCERIHEFFGVGHVTWSPRRKPHYDDEATYAVQALGDLVNVIVPFMDEHLPPSYKRSQFLEWRAELLAYWEHKARRRHKLPCSIEDCELPQRAKGLCRGHYYRTYGS